MRSKLTQLFAALKQLLQRSKLFYAEIVATLRKKQASKPESGKVNFGDERITVGQGGVKADNVDGSIVTGNYNTIKHILNVYLQPSDELVQEKEASALALNRYLNWVENRYGHLNLRGVGQHEQQALSFTLDDIYISLMAQIQPERIQDPLQELALSDVDTRQIGTNHLLVQNKRLVIIGSPGSGKTTYLHMIATALARALRTGQMDLVQTHLGLTVPLPLPFIIPLNEYNKYRHQHQQNNDSGQGTLIHFISHYLIHQNAILSSQADFFEQLLLQGETCILLFDGLDEVADDRDRLIVRQAIENLAHNRDIRQMLVTSRSQAYRGQAVLPEDFHVAVLQRMTIEQRNALAAHWCASVYHETDVAVETAHLQNTLTTLDQLHRRKSGSRLVNSPLMVTIVAMVQYNQRRLPDQRVELYEKCIEQFLTEGYKPPSEVTYDLVDWGGTVVYKRQLLAFLAYQMMNAGSTVGRTVSERQLRDWLLPHFSHEWGEDEGPKRLSIFIRAMRERGSLLYERDGYYQFTHLTFQEYLCAIYLVEVVHELNEIVAFLLAENRVLQPWWRETIFLTIGYLSLRSEATALDLLQILLEPADDNEINLAVAELAGTAFTDLEIEDDSLRNQIITKLMTLLSDIELVTSPDSRLLAGESLGRLGDHRPGVCTQEPEMVHIPAGIFLMGKAEDELYLDGFAIGKYPITNAQFRYFIEDGGYEERWRACWTSAGWESREMHQWTKPRLWDNEQFNQENQPVFGVSWYEAVAYTNWLSKKTRKPYRLPTEAEWERAARHTDGRKYPWGEQLSSSAAINFKAHGLNQPAAVGIFPQDTAVSGVQDMAGNIQEWCQTRWRNESKEIYTLPYTVDDDREDIEGDFRVWRVIRGGSYALNATELSCHFRDWHFQFSINDVHYGFRVAMSLSA